MVVSVGTMHATDFYYSTYTVGNACNNYAGLVAVMQVVLSVTVMLVYLSVAIMQVTVSVATMQLD